MNKRVYLIAFFKKEIILGQNRCHFLKRENISSLEHGIQFVTVYLTSSNMGPICHLVVFSLKMVALKVGINLLT